MRTQLYFIIVILTLVRSTQENIDNANFPISISDLQDKYFDGEQLSVEEKEALKNFNLFRIDYLKAATSEQNFEERYFELLVKANLSSFKEFL